MSFCGRMESNEANVHRQPEITLSIFENCSNKSIWQTVFPRENREGPRGSVKDFKACEGADPKVSLTILVDGRHTIVGCRLKAGFDMLIHRELICVTVEP